MATKMDSRRLSLHHARVRIAASPAVEVRWTNNVRKRGRRVSDRHIVICKHPDLSLIGPNRLPPDCLAA